jgi:predicted ATPase/tetratricopeptide (TPR) repeat protein
VHSVARAVTAGFLESPAMAPSPATGRAVPWTLRLLGAVEARRGERLVTRWPSRAAALLLARLAMAPQQAHPREALVELLWPGVAHDAGRNRLRQVLSTLRSLFEEDGQPPVFDADRQHIRLAPESLRCDAYEFEQALRRGELSSARAAYGGELMPGFYEEWVLEARRHLAERFERLEQQAPAPADLPDRLPAPWTRAFGLKPMVRRLHEQLAGSRLVTIVGPGGCGKTRLSLETAQALLAAPPPGAGARPHFDRIVFVPLVDCRDDAELLQALARELRVSGHAPLSQIGLRLGTASVLLVLDNVEQVVEPLRVIAASLLQASPGLHLLLTSRRRLNVAGEQQFALAGLPLPTADADAAALRDNPAVALFIDRARAVRPDFGCDDDTLPALAALVRALDGLPLALELAASRVGSLTPAAMLAWLTGQGPAGAGRSQLDLLTRGGRGAEPRHASMGAVIDWSWQLLDEADRRAMAAVSVVAGDAGLEMLAAVLGETPTRLARRVDDLVGHSMLRPRAGDPPRFALAEPVREFVCERWPAAEQARLREAWLQQLGSWALAQGVRLPAKALTDELPTVLLLLGTPGIPAVPALRLMLALRAHWEAGGMPINLQQALERLLDTGAAGDGAPDAPLASAAHELMAYLRFEAGFVPEAEAHADAALRLAGDDPSLRARALVRRCWVSLAVRRAEDDAEQPPPEHAALQQALALAARAGDVEAEARALHQWAIVLSHLGHDYVGAEAALARSQALWLQLGDVRKARARLRNRAQCWLRLGRAAQARQALEQALQEARDDGDVVGRIDSLISLSDQLARDRRWAQALAASRECVALCWQHWHRHGLAYALWYPARPLARLRRPEEAMRLMAFAARFWQDSFGPLTRADRQELRTVQALVRRQIGPSRAAQCWAEGEALNVAQAVALLAATGP